MKFINVFLFKPYVMKTKLFTIAAFINFVFISAQVPIVEWKKKSGDISFNFAQRIITTLDGDFITTGIKYSNNKSNISVTKLNSNGNILWQKDLEHIENTGSYSIQSTSDGEYILAGYISNKKGDSYDENGLIIKLNNSGDIQWQKILGGSSTDEFKSIETTSDGGYIVAGSSNSNDGDVNENNGSTDVWIVKLNSVGNILWQKSLGGIYNDRIGKIINSKDGGYVIAGSTITNRGTFPEENLNFDAWVVKLNSLGVVEWGKTFGGSGADVAYSLKQTLDEGFIIAGMNNSSDGDIIGNNGAQDSWIIKLNNIGELQWQKSLGTEVFEMVTSIDLTKDGGYILSGKTSNTEMEISDGASNNGLNAFVIKLNDIGLIQWQKIISETGYEYPKSIIEDKDGDYVIAGFNKFNLDYDAWIVKLATENLTNTIFKTKSFTMYPNPTTSIINFESPNNSKIGKVVISELTGKTLIKLTENTKRIDIQNLSKGLYLIEVYFDNEKFIGKFLKE